MGKERLTAFSDAVLAIVMTILEPVFTRAGDCDKIGTWKKKAESRTRAT